MKQLFFLLLSAMSVAGLQAQDSLTYRPHYLNARIQTVHGRLIIGAASHRTFVINGKKERLDQMSHRLAVRMGLP